MLRFEREHWFALQVMSRHERAVDIVLAQRGYEHFLPTCRVRHRWSDRMKVVEQPLFPGYVFCKGQPSLMDVVRSTPGIIRIVNFGGRPHPVPNEEIEALQRVVESKRDICAVPYFCAGQKVEIIAGPLSGITGMITRLKNRDRLLVSVDLIMRSVSIEIDRTEVTAMSAQADSGSKTHEA